MLKLGSQTASLVNHLASRGVIGQPVPVVGMGASILMWSDRHAASIVKVEPLKSKRYSVLIEVQEDKAVVVKGSGHDGSAEYEYFPNPDGAKRLFAMCAVYGYWKRVERNERGALVMIKGGPGLQIGRREEYRDPSF